MLEGSNPDWRRIAVAARENHPTACSSLGPIYWKGLSCWSHTWYHVLYLSDNIATNHAHIVSLFLSEGSSDLSMIERGLLSLLSSLSRSDLAPICDGILKFQDQSHVVVKMLWWPTTSDNLRFVMVAHWEDSEDNWDRITVSGYLPKSCSLILWPCPHCFSCEHQ